jgi:hypothetical protein
LAVPVPAVKLTEEAEKPAGAVHEPPIIEELLQKSITRLCAPAVAGVMLTR